MPLNSNDIIEALRTDPSNSSFDVPSNSIRVVADPYCPPGYAYYVPTAAWVDGIDTSSGTITAYTGEAPVASSSNNYIIEYHRNPSPTDISIMERVRNEYNESLLGLMNFHKDPPPEYSVIQMGGECDYLPIRFATEYV